MLLELFGAGVNQQRLMNGAETGLDEWYAHLQNDWGLTWIAVAVGVLAGFNRLRAPPLAGPVLVLLLQAAACFVVYYASILDVAWHLTTSLDRLFLQWSPAALCLAVAAGMAPRPTPPPSVPSKKKKP